MLQLLHTPEGVRDYYSRECAEKLALCGKIRRVFARYGFQEIQTPVFEYFDIFNAERGSVASRNMYKLFDRDGETLVLRPDFTPAIARCAAKYYGSQDLPVRLSYLGNTYVNTLGYRGQLKETTQAGVELVGDSGVAANAEMLALAAELLLEAGLTRFQIEVGDVRFFNSLMAEAGLPEEARRELRESIENKNHFAIEELLSRYPLSENLKKVLARLPQLFGDPADVLKEARSLSESEASLHAIDRLERLCRYMDHYGLGKYISFDLGMLGAQGYYTGIIFKGYTYGTGDHIVTGGRYDNLMEQFGKKAPSIGFGCNVDTLLQALSRQNIPVGDLPEGTLVLFARERAAQAVELAVKLRREGAAVTLLQEDGRDLSGLQEYVRENNLRKIIRFPAGSESVEEEVVPCE